MARILSIHLPSTSTTSIRTYSLLFFVDDERRAVAESVRVARRRFAIGWLNRSSLLYWQKGRGGGSRAYRGARWRTAGEVRALFSCLLVCNLKIRSAIFLPSATYRARWLEQGMPSGLPWGELRLASGEKA